MGKISVSQALTGYKSSEDLFKIQIQIHKLEVLRFCISNKPLGDAKNSILSSKGYSGYQEIFGKGRKCVPRGEERKRQKKGLWMESWILGPEAAEGQGSCVFRKQIQCQENQRTCWGEVSQVGSLSHFSGEAGCIRPMFQDMYRDALLAF